LTVNSLVFRAHHKSRYSLAALLGAIEIDERFNELHIEAPLEKFDSVIANRLNDGLVIAAFTVMSTQIPRVKDEVQQIRNRFGNKVVLVAGGPHSTARPRDTLKMGFNFVIVGEGEYAFPALLERILDRRDVSDIPGVVTDTTGKVPTPRELSPVELDLYPPFALEKNVVGPIEVTRGCPFRCKFCATPFLSGGSVRHRSVDTIVYWLRQAVKRSGFERAWLLSPNALCYGGKGAKPNPEKLESLLYQATSVDDLDQLYFGSFPSEVRPEFVNRPLLKMLRNYVANDSLQIGIQSGSNEVLQLSNRHHTVEEGMEAVACALECGFVPHVDMIFGLPGESEKNLERSIDLCYDLGDMGAKIHGHVFMPLPGSDFEHEPAGRLPDHIRSKLGDLSRRGVMTGSWYNQELLGKELEEF